MKSLVVLSVLVCGLLFAASPAKAEGEAAALTARIVEDGAKSRVEIGFSERVPFRVFSLDEPKRIVIDFPPVAWRADAPRPGLDTPLIGGLRFGLRSGGGGRMVVDLRAPARPVSAFTGETTGAVPALFVIEIGAATADAFAADAGWPEDVNPETPMLSQAVPQEVVVVIDPGHGGRDIGAVSGALAEARLMLEYAKELAAKINARSGYRAALTRDEDVFLTLRQRVDIARDLDADVFLSLHADSLEQGVASGASVYTLSEEATTEEAAALAESANRADTLAGASVEAAEDDVTRILIDLAQRRTSDQSETLATSLVRALEGKAPMLRGREMQAAGFRVLKAPDVPSVLLELGFLSSPRDRERLLSEEGRANLIEAIARGVFEWVEAQDGERYAPARLANGG